LNKQVKRLMLVGAFFILTNSMVVNAVEGERHMLIPGGDAVGIHIQSEGLIVVDTFFIETECGHVSPAGDAGLLKGDIITEINEQPVYHIEEYKEALIKHDGHLRLTIKRDSETSKVIITGCRNLEGEVSTGLYLRNKIAGIGTLTYIDPSSKKYGALGHEIIDQDTNQIVDIYEGQLIGSTITSIRKAVDGNPGEKIADIYFDQAFGSIDKNNQYGIYGEMTVDDFNVRKMIPIAYRSEVEVGPATIFTVLDGENIEEFGIEILEVEGQIEQDIKGIKYMVTDERLIQEAGGIVQGMSGSPIVQNDRIIGAVTHVLVNDSKLGYGVFIEWMLEESEINYLRNIDVIQTHELVA